MSDQRKRAVLMVVACVLFFVPFMMSAVGVSLPTIGRQFNASAVQIGLVETAYMVAAVIWLLPAGRLADLRGRRRIFRTGVSIFTVFSVLIPMAWSMESMIVMRFLQGTGGAMLMATNMALVAEAFGPGERGRAMGICTAAVYLGISVGPFLGGIITTSIGWRWIFYGTIPFLLMTLYLSLNRLGEDPPARRAPFDWKGSVIIAAAIVAIMVGSANLSAGPAGWGIMLSGFLGIGLFLLFESRISEPILDVELLRTNKPFTFGNLAALVNYAATFGITFFLSLYLQYVHGMNAREAGMILMVQPLIQAVLSPSCGKLADRRPPELVATAGMVLCALGVALASQLGQNSGLPMVFGVLGLLGVGFALFASPNMSVIMGSVGPSHYGVAASLSAAMRTFGMTLSMTMITIAFSLFIGGHSVSPETIPGFLRSMQTTLLTCSGLCVIAVFLSLGRVSFRKQLRAED